MEFVKNIPFFSIVLAMFSGILTSAFSDKAARKICIAVMSLISGMSGILLLYLLKSGESFTYMMGHYPAPWGNELRAGVLEALAALFFSLIMLVSLIGGMKHVYEDIESEKINLYFILVLLLLSSLLALVYTNDLFTAYVFVEINTIAACGLIMIRQIGRTFLAAVRYMVMSLLGSGLFLIGLSLLYDLTGHLLMSNAKAAVEQIMEQGAYSVPLTMTIALISIGLTIKSGLFPFHSWMPEAYGYSTAASSAILSGLVSKGYIFLLIKIFYRVFGSDALISSKIGNVLFVFGLAGIIMGSVSAIRETDIRRMVAFSSVAQIGYIYMGIGLGTEAGMTAAVFHMFSHGATKALLFIASVGLSEVSGDSKKFRDLVGAGYRNKTAGAAFTIGALSMVGIPMLSGFISKLLFASAAVQVPGKILPAQVVLAVSTILNAVYFLRAVICIYTPVKGQEENKYGWSSHRSFITAAVFFVLINVALGMLSQPIVDAVTAGLGMFS